MADDTTTAPEEQQAETAGDEWETSEGKGGKAAVLADLAATRKRSKELEERLKALEPLAAKAKELEDAGKSEIEKATEKLTAAERRAAEAELKVLRLEVAAEKGLTAKQAARLVGSSKEELEADADELLAAFGASDDDKPAAPRRPVSSLKPGASPASEPDETDPRKLALAARARGSY